MHFAPASRHCSMSLLIAFATSLTFGTCALNVQWFRSSHMCQRVSASIVFVPLPFVGAALATMATTISIDVVLPIARRAQFG